ncbi:endonuclease [Gilvimarinus agarilyticus]|nr:endonuclease [Gilvimarinus agarilyticus]
MKKITTLAILFCALVQVAWGQIPTDYYTGTDGLTGEELKLQLHQIIRGHTVKTYADFRDTILPDLDEDPDNSDNIILFYKNNSIPKSNFASNNQPDFWNREHTWPKSHGFPDEADTAYTDVHNLRPSDATVNTSKSNKDFSNVEHTDENAEGEAPDTYTDSDFWEPRDEIKGDVARILFYMATRYESDVLDLELVDRASGSSDPELGVLYTLIRWHEADPVDTYEQERHEGAYGYQENRNPFVDHPEWVAAIFGSATDPNLIVDQNNFNPDFGKVALGSSLVQSYTLKAYNLTGDVSVAVAAPFSLSSNGTDYAQTLTLASDGESEQSFNVSVKYEPGSEDEEASATVTHTTDGDTYSFEVTGSEGTQELISIAEARQKDEGEIVYVTGIVISAGTNSADNKFIYDGTAGLVVRSFDAGNESENLVLGDEVTVSGPLTDYNSLLEIDGSPIVIDVLNQNVDLPTYQEVTIAEIGEAYESEPVIIRNVTFDDAGDEFAYGNFTISDDTGSLIFRIGNDLHPLVGETIPSGSYDIQGFIGQYFSDYQLFVNGVDDLIKVAEPEVPFESIAEVRLKSEGQSAKIKGIVIGGENNSEHNRVVYDGTAGLVVRSLTGDLSAPLTVGDSVVVQGEALDYNGLFELEGNDVSITVLNTDNTLPDPQEISIAEIGEDYESELIHLSGVSIAESGDFGQGEYTLTDGDLQITFKIGTTTHDLVGTAIPAGTFDLTGYVGESSDGYEVYARTAADISNVSAVLGATASIDDQMRIYPNPAADMVTITLPADYAEDYYQLNLYQMSGQLIYSRFYHSQTIEVDVSEVHAGVYWLQAKSAAQVYMKKLVIH